MRTRAAFVTLVVLIILPAQARTQGGPPGVVMQLADEIAALRARVEKLESGAVEAADFVGTYRLYSLGIELLPLIPGVRPAKVGPEAGAATIVLRSDGTGSIAGSVGRFNLVQGSWIVEDTSTAPFEVEITWSYANGVLSLGSGGEFNVVAGAGARMLIAGTGNGDATGSWSLLLVGIRVP